jgi:integrase
MNEEQRIKFRPIAQGLLKMMYRMDAQSRPEKLKGEAGSTIYHPENAKYFFSEWKNEILEDLVHLNDETVHGPDAIWVDPEQASKDVEQDVAYVEELEKLYDEWNKIDNPVQKLQDDLRARNCTEGTVQTYTRIAVRYMIRHNFAPTFDHHEVQQYINSLKGDMCPKSQKVNRVVLKAWWDAMGMPWPLKDRRIHEERTEEEEKVASFTESQIKTLIKKVKSHPKATDEDRFYVCLATTWAPRRVELASMKASNFNFNGKTGTLRFKPFKHGLLRQHSIPENLMPYLTGFDVKPCSQAVMSRKFREMCRRIDFKLPKNEVRRKNYGWHAFRHGLDTALLEAGINPAMVRKWFGWRPGAMEEYYYMPENLDAKVLAKHPYLKFW